VIFNNSQENTETKQKKPEDFLKSKEYTAANPKKFEDPADSARNAFGLLKRKSLEASTYTSRTNSRYI
jgi:hypothetical protein